MQALFPNMRPVGFTGDRYAGIAIGVAAILAGMEQTEKWKRVTGHVVMKHYINYEGKERIEG